MEITIRNANFGIQGFTKDSFSSKGAQFQVYCKNLAAGNTVIVTSDYWGGIYLTKLDGTNKTISSGSVVTLTEDYAYVRFWAASAPAEDKNVTIAVSGSDTVATETTLDTEISNAATYFPLSNPIPEKAVIVSVQVDSGTLYTAASSTGSGLSGLSKTASRKNPSKVTSVRTHVRVAEADSYPQTLYITYWVYKEGV